ncbi:MAG TPA: class I SAM-dependent methyltransferase [Terriglobales bacterium]|nr:class I SAM-dependent methyltransferase [Terriglobales bacterium]
MFGRDFAAQVIICPSCHAQLTDRQCANCGEVFRRTLGVLDLRWPKPPQREVERDQDLVSELLAQFECRTFQDLCEMVRRHHLGDIPDELAAHLGHRSSNMLQIGDRMVDMFERRLSKHFAIPSKDLALDIGCGYGTATRILASQFRYVIGIDPYLPVLLLAKKLFEDRGARNVILIQAYAQRIPIDDGRVDYAIAQNVIEHLIDVEPALQEINRILRQGGCFCGDSRNRYDLFFPEPHVRLRWVGLLPRRLQPWYVRRFKGVSYADWHVRLQSWWNLHRCARRAFGRSARIVLPLVSAYGQPSKFDKWIERMDEIPVVGALVLSVFPSHLLVAQSA